MEPEFYILSAGDLFVFSEGEYSDYGISGFFRALKDFNMREVSELWAEEQKPFRGGKRSRELKWDRSYIGFQAWLVVRGYAEDIETREYHTGSYGRFELW